MLGFRFIKTQPTQYVIQYKNGRSVREDAGLAFWCFAPSTSIVVVPTASWNEPFIFPEVTADFQEVTVQGQITYRVADPVRTSKLLDFTFGMMKSFAGADPKLLQALASVGMDPGQLMALAFRDLADNATKIGQLNVTPDPLREMMQPQGER